MIARRVLQLVSHLPTLPSDLADWYDEMRDIAEDAQRQRIEDEAHDDRDMHDMARWLREPDRRRPAPRKERHR